jgi:hypothetical protein
MVTVSQIGCQSANFVPEGTPIKLNKPTKGISFKGGEESASASDSFDADAVDTKLFTAQDELQKKIDKTKNLFERTHAASKEIADNSRFGFILRPIFKTACVGIVAALGFFVGKMALANKLVKGSIRIALEKFEKATDTKVTPYIETFYDKIASGLLRLKEIIKAKKPDPENKFKTKLHSVITKAFDAFWKWGKKGINADEVENIAKRANTQAYKGVAPDTVVADKVIKEINDAITNRAVAQNLVLQTLGAGAGVIGAVNAGYDATKTPFENMPDVVKKHASKATMAAVMGG